jgi:phage shock protein PspC (stress-responsive transcriptional regulator)
MWAGVAGGMAEFFDLDPSLVRLLWVAATVVSGGLAVAVYILAWIVLPRDDRPAGPPHDAWHNWSEDFHRETDRLAEEARRATRGWQGTDPDAPPTPTSSSSATSSASTPAEPAAGPSGEPDPWWQSERYVERHHGHHYPARSAGVVLVVLGVLLLAANAGVFTWIQWRTMWPLIFIGLGVILLGRQSGWWGR